MAIGTDSLSSNWQLSIFEEMKTIQRFQSSITTEMLVKWSSYHSAEALGYDHLGSIKTGKKPGLVALYGLKGDTPLLKDTDRLERLL